MKKSPIFIEKFKIRKIISKKTIFHLSNTFFLWYNPHKDIITAGGEVFRRCFFLTYTFALFHMKQKERNDEQWAKLSQ